jgi:UDP:flavonoid glycosyltransferase YjiC (YdhE family)
MLALALALRAAGHSIVFAGPPENRSWIVSAGLRFAAIGEDFMAFSARHPDIHRVGPMAPFLRFLRGLTRRQFSQMPPVFRGADRIVASSLTFAARSVAQALGIDYRFVAFCPQVFQSSRHPTVFFRRHGRSPFWNRFSWWIDGVVDRLLMRPVLNAARGAIGLPALRESTLDHILAEGTLLAADAPIAPLPPDVKKPVVRCGALHLASDDGLSSDLVRFIAEGSRPVFVGFGSMPRGGRGRLMDTVDRAARRCGRRFIVSQGSERRITQSLYSIGDVPFSKLFPHMRAVIHHGGAGTTATGALSGVPQIIVPHLLDQFYWAQRIHALGLGPEPLWRSRFSAPRLSDRVMTVLSDPHFTEAARTMARRLSPRQNLAAAVRALAS